MGALPIVPRSEKSKELVDFQDGIYTLSGNFETELGPERCCLAIRLILLMNLQFVYGQE